MGNGRNIRPACQRRSLLHGAAPERRQRVATRQGTRRGMGVDIRRISRTLRGRHGVPAALGYENTRARQRQLPCRLRLQPRNKRYRPRLYRRRPGAQAQCHHRQAQRGRRLRPQPQPAVAVGALAHSRGVGPWGGWLRRLCKASPRQPGAAALQHLALRGQHAGRTHGVERRRGSRCHYGEGRRFRLRGNHTRRRGSGRLGMVRRLRISAQRCLVPPCPSSSASATSAT